MQTAVIASPETVVHFRVVLTNKNKDYVVTFLTKLMGNAEQGFRRFENSDEPLLQSICGVITPLEGSENGEFDMVIPITCIGKVFQYMTLCTAKD
jgi:hypothetical protein